MAALGMLGTGFATNIATLLPCRLLVGAGAAASEVGTVAYLADLTEQPRLRPHRGVIIGLKSSCGAAAWCAGPAIGGFLGSAFGAPAAFFTVGAIQGAASMLYSTLPESSPGASQRTAKVETKEEVKMRVAGAEAKSCEANTSATMTGNSGTDMQRAPASVVATDGGGSGSGSGGGSGSGAVASWK